MTKARLLFPTLFTLFAVTVCLALGTWQVKRLFWKQEVIATIKNRIALPAAMDLCEKHQAETIDIKEYEYRKVFLKGTLYPARELYLYVGPIKLQGEQGYRLLTPFRCENGAMLLVDRGWTPTRLKTYESRREAPVQHVKLEGWLMKGEKKTWMAPKNNAEKNIWVWIDMPHISSLQKAEFGNYYVMLQPGPDTRAYPLGKAITPAIRNDHLSYIITWYGLAIAALVIYLHYRRKHS